MDVEKQNGSYVHGDDRSASPHLHGSDLSASDDVLGDPGETQVIKIRQQYSVLRALRNFESWVDRQMKFEASGVERVPEEKRKPPQVLNASFCLCYMSLLS